MKRKANVKKRCAWAEGVGDLYLECHDNEWGVPVHNDNKHFEFLILEGAQAGLSWSTILKKEMAIEKLSPTSPLSRSPASAKRKSRTCCGIPGS